MSEDIFHDAGMIVSFTFMLKGIDWSQVDHWSNSLMIKPISLYLQHPRVNLYLDPYYIGMHFAPNSLTETKK